MTTMGKVLPLRRAGQEEHLSDESLLAACAQGESAAMGLLFDRFHAPLYRFLSRYVGTDRAELDDLVQATFLEVLRSAGSFRRQAAVRTWIFGIAVNLARHHARSQGRRRALTGALREAPAGPAAPRPDEAAERRQLLVRLERALPELSDDLRIAFVMCDLEGVPGVEAARVLGLREGTLWRRLHDARQRLRAALDGPGVAQGLRKGETP